ncbi:MAG TPA: ABC transporter substrate-binding protein [Fibrobacteria bacterium]|nr:ABC transporter substrate-binding protein [Fibrobacteria bacterium]
MKPTLLFSCVIAAALAPAWCIQDMAGREVKVRTPVARAYSTSPVGEIFLYTLAPGKVVGLSWTLRARETPWLLATYAKRPVLGGWFGKSSGANLEEIVKVHPDVIVSAGTMDPQSLASSEKIQGKTGLPVVAVDGSLERIPDAYRFLGTLVGAKERADTLADWADAILEGTRSRAKARRDAPRPRIYYAEGLSGLETDPGGSSHTELIEWLGATNVAQVPLRQGFGRSPVSFEQILSWDPDWILVGEDHTDPSGARTLQRLKSAPKWKLLRAVRENRIVRIPDLPFNWFDRPPAPSRLLGALWLESVLFPKDMPKTVFLERMRGFFRLFYHRELGPRDEAAILDGSWPG